MNLFHRQYIVLFAIIVMLSVLVAGASILQKDWQVAHRGHSVIIRPVNWFGYNLEILLAKAKRKVFSHRDVGLPQVRLYISETSQKALLSNVPESTKKWREGYRLIDDGALKKVKVRHRGDNPANWMFGRKSWRVKARKKDILDRVRTYDYISPQGIPWKEYGVYALAKKMGVITPRVRLIELFINDNSTGVILERERLDESFVRNAGLMPINLYKGEQYNLEAKVRVDDSLFNNPGLWKKSSVFNQLAKEDYSDLENLITLLRRAESSDQDLAKLFEILPVDVWANFAAFRIIGSSFHDDWIHNLRIAIDPWSGHAHPIPHDLGWGELATSSWENPTHDIFRLLNMQPSFLLSKYRRLYRAVAEEKVYSAVSESLSPLAEPIRTTLGRDVHLLQDVYHHDLDRNYLSPAFAYEKFIEGLSDNKETEKRIKHRLSKTPKAEWRSKGRDLFLSVDGELPVGKVFINLQPGTRRVSEVTVDMDRNGKTSEADIVIPVTQENRQLIIDAAWFAERVPAAIRTKSGGIRFRDLMIRKTQFKLMFPDALSIQSISIENPITFQKMTMPRGKADGARPSSRNKPVTPNVQAKPEIWSGTVDINKDRIIRTPVIIRSGTKILMGPGASLVFRGPLRIAGDLEHPVRILPSDETRAWGALALVGPKTTGSTLSHLIMSGGSGDTIENIRFVGMLSVHNTADITLENVTLKDNKHYDDMMHAVYVTNLKIAKSKFQNPNADGLDIDLSENVMIEDASVTGAGNDAIDLMESKAVITRSKFIGSGDKGISVGEDSRVLIVDTILENNTIGLESKDGSLAQVLHANITNNKTQISAYQKNWRYGNGGRVDIRKSILISKNGAYDINKKSNLKIQNSILTPRLKRKKRITIGPDIRQDTENLHVHPAYGTGVMKAFTSLREKPDSDTIGASR
jgi:hypothetical protein